MSSDQKTSVWFLGTSLFAVPSLEALAQDRNFTIERVITQPDRPVGRKQELTPPAVKIAAEKLKLNVFQTENINIDLSQLETQNSKPDFLVVVSFGQILSQTVLDLPRIAPVNVHASLLPRWRGASPLQHAILTGDHESGVTVQKIVKELDAGPVLAQQSLILEQRETAVTLHDKLAALGAALLVHTLQHPLHPTEQDPSGITLCRKLARKDSEADPQTMTAEQIDRMVRAFTPWPGVTITVNGQAVKLISTSLSATEDSVPLVCANNTSLHIISIQPTGKKAMTGAEWKRGIRGM